MSRTSSAGAAVMGGLLIPRPESPRVGKGGAKGTSTPPSGRRQPAPGGTGICLTFPSRGGLISRLEFARQGVPRIVGGPTNRFASSTPLGSVPLVKECSGALPEIVSVHPRPPPAAPIQPPGAGSGL